MSDFRRSRKRGWFARTFGGDWSERLTSPFRFIGWLASALSPSRLFRRLGRIASKAFRFQSPKWQAAQNLVTPPSHKIHWAQLGNPVYLVVWSFRFIWSWLLTRPYSSVIPSLPAVLVGLGGFFGWIYQRESFTVYGRAAQYQQVVNASLGAKDFKKANVALGTLIDLDPENLTYRYQFAGVQEELGHPEYANELVERLAVTKQHGPSAMAILGKQFDFQKLAEWSPETHAKFKLLSDIAIKGTGGSELDSAKLMRAQYQVSTGSYQEALRSFAELAERRGEFALTAAVLSNQLGDETQRSIFGERSIRFYEEKLKVDAADIAVRMQLAKALLLMQREEAAAKILEEGYAVTKNEGLRSATAEAFAIWAKRLGRESKEPQTLIRRLNLVESALLLAPNNGAVIEASVNLIMECRENQNEEVRLVRAALMRGVSPVGSHFIQGTLALMNGKFEEGKTHLELATKLGAQTPGILNNLAVAIAGMPDPNLEQALELSNAAIRQMPNHAYMHETRGQILIKLERWQDAIVDLELALSARELRPAIYPSLAQAYRALGNEQLAADYEAELAAIGAAAKTEKGAATSSPVAPKSADGQ
jgi:predicted Zn-dependent protease